MKKRTIAAFLFIVLLFGFAACSSDDNSNPSEPDAPATVGTYAGTNSMDTTMSITISNIDGTAHLTGYDINYKNADGTKKGKRKDSKSAGLAVVANNTFSYSVGNESDEILMGTITGNTITGSFKFPATPLSESFSGTFSIIKQ